MGPFGPIQHAINEFIHQTGAKESELLIVMGDQLMEVLKYYNRDIMVGHEKPVGEPDRMFGVEIVIHERIKDDFFGIMWESCRDHIDDHLDEVLGAYEIPDGVEWIQCDLCQHPLSIELAVGDDIVCPWCGDVNDLRDLFGGDDE